MPSPPSIRLTLPGLQMTKEAIQENASDSTNLEPFLVSTASLLFGRAPGISEAADFGQGIEFSI